MPELQNPVLSETPPRSAIAPLPLIEALQRSLRSLRQVLYLLLIALLITTGSWFVFLLREVSLARRQVRELAEMVAGYDKNDLPILREFRTKMIDFAKANPDFVSILSKYIHPTNYSVSAQSSPSVPPARVIPVIPDK